MDDDEEEDSASDMAAEDVAKIKNQLGAQDYAYADG